MPSSQSTMTEIVMRRVRTKYHWPAIQLNLWLVIMLVGSSSILGIFSSFIAIQHRLEVNIPWYFSYWVTVSTLSVTFILIMLWLIAQRQLLPGIVIMGSVILFILWLVGLIVISLELWGPSGDVNTNCQLRIESHPVSGISIETLAWLEQHSICQAWQAAWSFQLIGCAFLLWITVMAYQVYQGEIY